ncbi:MAG: RNA 3'-terminal phosphate cyclase [Candidatus Bathyarchaeota archaeon]|jgi:RNA 3'-terminal phosphate cyclase (ATP)
MIEIDGGQRSGSGTILRVSLSLAAILGETLHIHDIRRNRPQPGLRPQHLAAVTTAGKLCNAKLQGASLASRELFFEPETIKTGVFKAEIGTAGSITMLIATLLPICAYAKDAIRVQISKGGTDVRHSPTINYMRFVLLPILKCMGLHSGIDVKKYGYYPKGLGEVTLASQPCESFQSLSLENRGTIKTIEGISVCTFLHKNRVAERQARAAEIYLRERGYPSNIQVVNDKSNPSQKGSSLVLWATTDTGAILGSDAIGEIKKTSEMVGLEAAEKLYNEISSKATVDVNLADLLIPYMGLAEGKSTYLTRAISDHLSTNIWLVKKILKVKFKIEKVDDFYKIEKKP